MTDLNVDDDNGLQEFDPSVDLKGNRRTYKGRKEAPEIPPDVIYDTVNGSPVVRVELFGSIIEARKVAGRGVDDLYVTLDAEDWPAIRDQAEWWTLSQNGVDGAPFVARGIKGLSGRAKQSPTSHPNMKLARLVMDLFKERQDPNDDCGERGGAWRVLTMNNDQLDLRKENLHWVENRAEENAFRATAGAFEATFTDAEREILGSRTSQTTK